MPRSSSFSRPAQAAFVLLVLSCSKKEADVHAAGTPSASAGAPAPPAASAAPDAPVAAGAAPLAALDTCLVGRWKASGATLKVDAITAQGGANVMLDIAPSGASVIDFGPMADVRATGPSLTFDFRYSGKASGTLTSPTRGTLRSENADYSALRVTANVKLPGAGSISLFKDTPLTELATMGTALAGAAKGLPKAKSAADAPSSQPGTSPQGIDSNPVFASSSYTCQANSLSLHGGKQGFEWQFVRAP